MTSSKEQASHISNAAEQAGEWAIQAMHRIRELKLLPSPEVYELWYRFYQGDADIVRAVEDFQGAFTEDVCKQIYNKYLSETEQGKAMRRISEQVQSSIAELAEMLGTAKNATTDYGDTLDEATNRIRSISTMDELELVVTNIVKDTKKMVEKNAELEIQLVSSSKQITELKTELDSITREVMTDGLTGLNNRKAFDKRIADCVAEADKIELPLVLLLIDIDHFKKFNDSYGHQVGDQVLRLVARTLTDNVKGRDIAARYGGEEFAIILPDTEIANGLKVAESLRRNVENKEIVNKGTGKTLGRITLSIGITQYLKGEPIPDLISRADKALYDAKKNGRNQVQEAPLP